MKRVLLAPFSLLYLAIIRLRHLLFDWGVLRSRRFGVATLCVGNITVGGTGKSPMCELLLEELGRRYNVALLSRGYGRKSRGYIEVQSEDDYLRVGDEPLQMKRKFTGIVVAVCESRTEGIERILAEHPTTNLIVMDDGFQHRYVEPWVNIIMIDATRPISSDMMLPAGSLRDTPERLKIADIFVITKCRNEAMIERAIEGIKTSAKQSVFASEIENEAAVALFPSNIQPLSNDVIALAGIGNPTPFLEMIKERYNLVERLIYADHHSYTATDIDEMKKVLKRHPQASILMTEKDSVKLRKTENLPDIIRERSYLSPIKMNFIKGSAGELIEEVVKRLNI